MLVTWLAILMGIVLSIFWFNEWKYTLPTPVPQDYKIVRVGTKIEPGKSFAHRDKPIVLHFFNPGCPCSRFNMKHVKELINLYGDQVNFMVVLVTEKPFTQEEIQKKYNLKIPVIQDPSFAKKCGVYSTPQAVILTKENVLYYRGNYNKSRYCVEKESNYVQIALERLLNDRPEYKFNHLALKAYGCELPGCTNNLSLK